MREQEAGTHLHTRRNGTGPVQGRGRVVPAFTTRQYWTDVGMRGLLCLAALSSIAITVGIVGVLLYEASTFFRHVTVTEFLTDPLWTPLFAMPRYGIMPLVAGTVVTTGVALAVALPIGTIVAIYLSEYAPFALREILKPRPGAAQCGADRGLWVFCPAVRGAALTEGPDGSPNL